MYFIAKFIDIDFLLCATLFCENVNTPIEQPSFKKNNGSEKRVYPFF